MGTRQGRGVLGMVGACRCAGARARVGGHEVGSVHLKTCLILKRKITHLEGTSCARMPAEGAQMGAGRSHAGRRNLYV